MPSRGNGGLTSGLSLLTRTIIVEGLLEGGTCTPYPLLRMDAVVTTVIIPYNDGCLFGGWSKGLQHEHRQSLYSCYR
jgi:hypothetical protein